MHDRDAHGRGLHQWMADDFEDKSVRFASAEGQRLLVVFAAPLFALSPEDLGICEEERRLRGLRRVEKVEMVEKG